MDKIKAAVLIELDEHQKEELEAAGKDMVEFVYVPEDMSREERLPLLKQAQIIFGQPGIREINQCEHLRWIQMFSYRHSGICDCSAAGTLQKSENICSTATGEKMESDPFGDASLWKAGTDSRCRRYWDRRGRTALCVRCQNNRDAKNRPELS